MKREDAHNNVKEWIDNTMSSGNKTAHHYGKIELHRDIDKIYDDFENRLCETCRYNYRGCGIQDSIIRRLTVDPNFKTFGCNKWESK